MNVKVVDANEHVAVVEYVEEPQTYRRVVVPAHTVAGETCPEDVLQEGIPYGEDWASWITGEDVPGRVANELHRRGLWTLEQLLARPMEVQSAFVAVAAQDLSDFLRAIRRR